MKQLDLSGGNFSETWFSHADLSDCNLTQSIWDHAHLYYARFEKNALSGASFQHAHLEKSNWVNVNFAGNFQLARLNGAKMSDCTISSMFNQMGCEWELVEMENVNQQDVVQLFEHRFEEQLSREHQEREEINHEISTLGQQYQACIQQIAENHDLTVKEEEDLARLHKSLHDMESQYTHSFKQLNAKIKDIKNQIMQIQLVQEERWEQQSEIMENMSKRLRKLENGDASRSYTPSPPKAEHKHVNSASFFKPAQKKRSREVPEAEITPGGPRRTAA